MAVTSSIMRLRSLSPSRRSLLLIAACLVLIGLGAYRYKNRYRLCEVTPMPDDFFFLSRGCNEYRPKVNKPPRWGTTTIPALRRNPLVEVEECHQLRESDTDPLVTVAVFAVAQSRALRDMHRLLARMGVREEHARFVEFVFVVGKSVHEEAMKMLRIEQALYGDLVLLDEEENMNDGKTYFFYRWMANRAQRGGKRPRFVLKADLDTFFVLPHVLDSLASQNCSDLVYWGTSLGSCLDECFPPYMQGMGYALSWPLVEWIGTAAMESDDYIGIEDAKTGQYLLSLPHGGDELLRVELGTRLGAFEQARITKDVNTIGLHNMKDPLVYTEYAYIILDAWRRAKKEYVWVGPPPG